VKKDFFEKSTNKQSTPLDFACPGIITFHFAVRVWNTTMCQFHQHSAAAFTLADPKSAKRH